MKATNPVCNSVSLDSFCFTLHGFDFPTRSQHQSSTTIDNIFIDTYKFTNYTVFPIYNGLSDHDAQLLKINDVNLQQQNHQTYTIRNMNTQ